jgi:hypothetical protein
MGRQVISPARPRLSSGGPDSQRYSGARRPPGIYSTGRSFVSLTGARLPAPGPAQTPDVIALLSRQKEVFHEHIEPFPHTPHP